MKRVKSFDEFVNENIGAALGSPIKFIKIKKAAKRYQQAKLKQALNDVDFEKKKQASKGELDKKAMDTLKAANAAKNQALKDTASGESQRMKDLATTDGLKKVVTLATTKANLKAAQTALKSADAEETKQLKIKIKDLTKTAADAQADLKDYESTEKDGKKGDEGNPQGQSLDGVEGKEKKKKKTPSEEETTPPESETTPEETTPEETTPEEPTTKVTTPEETPEETEEETEKEKKKGKNESKEITEDRSSEIEKMIKDKAKPKTLVPKDSLPPSVGEELKEEHVGETMTDKFRRLMAKHNVQSS